MLGSSNAEGQQPERVHAQAVFASALYFLKFRMHFEIVGCELRLCIELLLAILTGIPGMDFAVMLFPLHLSIKRRPTFLTAILFILILRHLNLSFQGISISQRKSTDFSVLCLTNARIGCYRPVSTWEL